MSRIKAVRAREILDSRGNPTIETTLWADDGQGAIAAAPSGASTGKYEAVELRDGDSTRFNGMGVLKAVTNVNQVISKYLIGLDPTHQNEIDQMLLNLDGTINKSRLGANAILSVSQAVCELGARAVSMQTYEYITAKYGLSKPNPNNLPVPIFNIINGGKHGAGNLDFQEFHLIPTSRKRFSQNLEIGAEIYQNLKNILITKKAVHAVGDEGGFVPNLFSNTDAIELMIEAINASPHKLNQEVFIGLDIAASTFFQNKTYTIRDRKEPMDVETYFKFLSDLKKKYNLFSIEDPLEQDSWVDWVSLTADIGRDTMIVGDDLLVTNKLKLKEAIEKRACNAVLIKPNQIGTISECVSVVKMAKQNHFTTIASHRSGDTDENFMADFAVGVGADYVKFGAPSRGERVAKYNRLLYIEEYLSGQVHV